MKTRNKATTQYFGKVNWPAVECHSNPQAIRDNTRITLVQTQALMDEVCLGLLKELVIAVDTETNGLDAHTDGLLLIQLAVPGECYILDVPALTRAGASFQSLKTLLESPDTLKLLQNAKFDYKFFKAKLGIELETVYDTYLAEQLLTAGLELKASLADITERYLGEKMDKTLRKTFHSSRQYLDKAQLEYAAYDTQVLFPIYQAQSLQLQTLELVTIADIEFQCLMAVGDMELAGCKIDVAKWRAILAKSEEEKNQMETEIMALFPGGQTYQINLFGEAHYAVNLNSQQQIIAEFGKLGVQIPDTQEATLQKVNHPAAKLLLKYKEMEKIITAFGENLIALINPITGRVHPNFQQYGAATGRFSCIAEGALILIPGGAIPIQEIKPGMVVYSTDEDGSPVLKKVLNVFDNGAQECIRLNWKTNKSKRFGSLVCTPNHLIKTLNRGWVEAQNLTPQDNISFVSRGLIASRKRPVLTWGSYGSELEQIIIKRNYFGVTGKEYDIHHIDFNPMNNTLDNLEVITPQEHRSRHALNLSAFQILKMLAVARGKPTRVPMDFNTFKLKCVTAGVNWRVAASKYGDNGMYLGRGAVLNAVRSGNCDKAAKTLGIGTRRLKNVCEHYGVEYNHRIISIEKAGTYRVYDLEIEDTHNFIANELVVHNCSSPNLQQIPSSSNFRECFIPEPGYKMVDCDYSQCELRILSQVSADEGFIEVFTNNGDLHVKAASLMFNIPPEEVTKERRSYAKTINFGLAYGMGAQGLAGRIDKSVDEAQALIDAYFKGFPKVAKWLDAAGKKSFELGFSRTPLGRRRNFQIPHKEDGDYKRLKGSIERAGKNFVIQGANADISKMAMVFVRRRLKGLDARIISVIHDELLVEARADIVEDVKRIVEEEMLRAEKEVIKLVPCVADAVIADYWKK